MDGLDFILLAIAFAACWNDPYRFRKLDTFDSELLDYPIPCISFTCNLTCYKRMHMLWSVLTFIFMPVVPIILYIFKYLNIRTNS